MSNKHKLKYKAKTINVCMKRYSILENDNQTLIEGTGPMLFSVINV